MSAANANATRSFPSRYCKCSTRAWMSPPSSGRAARVHHRQNAPMAPPVAPKALERSAWRPASLGVSGSARLSSSVSSLLHRYDIITAFVRNICTLHHA